jgi:hypothetical protein
MKEDGVHVHVEIVVDGKSVLRQKHVRHADRIGAYNVYDAAQEGLAETMKFANIEARTALDEYYSGRREANTLRKYEDYL